MRILIFVLLLVQSLTSSATNYYVDASTTASTQNGLLATPWKTLAQVTANMNLFQPGDFVLFKRGEVFPGILYPKRGGTAAAPLTFGAYGTGARPKFIGTGAKIGYLFYVYDQSYINFRDLSITDPTIDNTDRHVDAKILRAFTFDLDAHFCKVISCDIQLVGTGGYFIGGNNTMDSCEVSNLRMMLDTDQGYQPGDDDDYGANPLVISSANNTLTHNYFHDCWANSYDYIYDGGAIEFYGSSTNNNLIAYNTIVDCLCVSEVTGSSTNNTFAYNKLINNGSLFYFQSGASYTNWKFYNNVVIENGPQRLAESRLIGGAISGLIMKNNIFHLSNGVDVASNANGITHEDNIYKLSNNSVIGFAAGASEMTTSLALFTNTTASSPLAWNFVPVAGSPAIDFGQNVGLTKDFAGNAVPTVPNSGILEGGSGSGTGGVLTAASAATNIICNGATSTITVSASGGTPPYTGTGVFTYTAGTYSFTITDATGTSATNTIVVSQPAVLNTSLIAGTINAIGGTTTITVTASGGTSAYTYKLNNGSFQSSPNFTGVTAGTHTIITKDAKGCTSTKSLTITEPAANNIVLNVTTGSIACNGETTSVVINATGGAAPYTGTGSFTVAAGTYTFSVKDANNQVKTTSVTVTQPLPLTATVTPGIIPALGGVTTVNIAATGGTAPYTYKLSNGGYQSSASFLNISAGDYMFTIRDARGCSITRSITVNNPSNNTLAVSATAGSIACNGGSATITVTATGGVAPYTGTGTYQALAGTRVFSVTDASGTTRSATLTIAQPAIISIAFSTALNAANGLTSITVIASGGTGIYQYKKNSGSYQTGNVLGNVSAGSHTITVKDARGCTATKSIIVTNNSQSNLRAVLSSSQIVCNGGTASITVAATGGTSPYTGTGTFSVSAGTYYYTVKDASGATNTASIVVAQPQLISVALTAGTIPPGGSSATVTVAASGGNGTYTYKLNNGTYQSSNIFNAVVAGSHTITVKDVKGCTGTNTIKVSATQGAAFAVKLISQTNNSCRDQWDGTISVGATGGVAPYLFQINGYGYGATSTFINLGPGTYTLYAKDATGLVSSMQVTILAGITTCLQRTATRATPAISSPGTGNVSNKSGVVYPNPSTSLFYLELSAATQETSTLTITNASGNLMERIVVRGSRKVSLGKGIPAGVYFLRVQNEAGITTTRIIKL